MGFLFHSFLAPLLQSHTVVAAVALGAERRLQDVGEPSLTKGPGVPKEWDKALLLFVSLCSPNGWHQMGHSHRNNKAGQLKPQLSGQRIKREGSMEAESFLEITES